VRGALGLRRWLRRAADAVVPPQLAVREHVTGLASTYALRAVVRLGVPAALAGGPRTGAEVATACGADADAMHRLLRALAHLGFTRLDAGGRFRATRLLRALRAGAHDSLAPFVEYFGSASNAASWADFETTVRTGRNAFERTHGVGLWEWFEAHGDERAVFAEAMAALTELEGPLVANAYPFAEIATVCDVGGGRGTLLALLLERHPHLRGVLVDSPGVLSTARPFLEARGVASRVELVAGSFFDVVPPGADGYVLKNVLHDWDDARCAAILARCRSALADRGRLLVVEEIVERDAVDAEGALTDLQMMTVCGEGRERGRDEYARLLAASGLALRRVFGAGAGPSVLEAVAA
jgi:hypothetical protein